MLKVACDFIRFDFLMNIYDDLLSGVVVASSATTPVHVSVLMSWLALRKSSTMFRLSWCSYSH